MARHPAPAAVELFDGLAGDLEQVEVDGAPEWTLAGDTATPPEPYRGIRLLPYFDAFVVAGQPRERLFPGAATARGLSPGVRPATTRSFSWMVWSVGSGTSGAQVAGSLSPSNRWTS
jgi:hypothetical protein